MKYKTLEWKKDRLYLLDQRKLPLKKKYLACSSLKNVYTAIKNMTVRGAPAIGIAAAYGVYLGIRSSRAKDKKGLFKEKPILNFGF